MCSDVVQYLFCLRVDLLFILDTCVEQSSTLKKLIHLQCVYLSVRTGRTSEIEDQMGSGENRGELHN